MIVIFDEKHNYQGEDFRSLYNEVDEVQHRPAMLDADIVLLKKAGRYICVKDRCDTLEAAAADFISFFSNAERTREAEPS